MGKTIAAIELGSRKVKLVIGYELDGKAYPIYTFSKPYVNSIENGKITNYQAIIAGINSFKDLYDAGAKLDLKISSCVLAMPSENLEILKITEKTKVLSERGKVSKTDIKNLSSLVKGTVNNMKRDSSLIDIIPESYILDENRVLKMSPVGENASTIVLSGKVHLIPKEIYINYVNLFESCGINVTRTVATPFANAEYLSTYHEMPKSYLLVDIGCNASSISLIGNNSLYASKQIYWGGDNITNKISKVFNCTFDDAEKLKCRYGIDQRILDFHPSIHTFDLGETKKEYYNSDLNKIVFEELDVFIDMLKASLDALLRNQDPHLAKLPIVFIGGGSKLHGFESFIRNRIENDRIRVFIPKTIGARDTTYSTCLGMILVANKYSNLDEEDPFRVRGITRD